MHTGVSRVGARLAVTGRERGENAAAPATRNEAARIAQTYAELATLADYLAVRHLI